MNNEPIDSASNELWERAKSIYIMSLKTQEEISQAERYLGTIKSVICEDNKFTIFTGTRFAQEKIASEYLNKLKGSFLVAGAPENLTIDVKFAEEIKQEIKPPVEVVNYQVSSIPNTPARTFIPTMPLNENYTFDEFVRGPSNSFAMAAALAIVSNPGKLVSYNPLFIHGGTGLGKTHLMQAIGNELKRKSPHMAICYITTETFLNEFVNSLQNGEINSFRDKYRHVDLLLMDDVQFLQRGKDSFQEEFFNTLCYLMQSQKQIVMTSDVPPKNLPSIQMRLISRFEGGMVQEIESPSYETRLAILKKKAEGMNIVIPDSVLEFIADNVKSHVRKMEGSLVKVSLAKQDDPSIILDKSRLEYILKDIIEKEQTLKKLTIEEIQMACAKKYGVSMNDILSHERTQSIVTPRQMAMYISRKYTSKGLKEIALAFDKKHATVINGVKTITQRLDNEKDLKLELSEILSSMGYQISDMID